MSEKKPLEADPATRSVALQTIGRLLRELYQQPEEPSPQLATLIAKLKESDSTVADGEFTHPSL
jgi:hypothetical protein